MSYVNPSDLVELMTDTEYEAFKDTLVNARAISPKTQTVRILDLYAALKKSGVDASLLKRYVEVSAVDSAIPVTNIEDLPNLVINNKAYLIKIKKPLILKRGGKLKLEVFTTLVTQRLTSLGYVPTLTNVHTLEINSQISKLVKYLTTHYLAGSLAATIHTHNRSISIYFSNGHRLVPLDNSSSKGKPYQIILGNVVQNSALTTVLLDSIMTTHAFPIESSFTGTVKQLEELLEDYGITLVHLLEKKSS